MRLATVGLGLKELSFHADGNTKHIHNVLLDAFSALNDCGGYTLHRLAPNSTDLITIEPPRGGITVKYLKDMLLLALFTHAHALLVNALLVSTASSMLI